MLFMIKENHQQNQLTNTKLLEQKNVKDGGFLNHVNTLMKE